VRRFFILILGLIFSANLACWAALNFILVRLSAPNALHWSLAVFILLQLIGMSVLIGARLIGYQPGTGMGRPILSLVMIWNLLLAIPTAALATVWAVILWLTGAYAQPILDSPWRTAGLIVASLPFVAALAATVAAVSQLSTFRINRIKLTIPNLPAELKGLTIAHLSDLHIGKLTRGQVLEDMVTATNLLQPDLILATGDLINMALEDLPKGFEILRAMKSRYGLFLVEGNHDLIENGSVFEASAAASGLKFLFNEMAAISIKAQIVQIIGLRWGDGMMLPKNSSDSVSTDAFQTLMEKRDPNDFTILLAHHPEVFDRAAEAGIPLTLAGHTHGGQLMLTQKIGFGPWLYKYWSGLYQKGSSQLVVSNGAGNWFPLRIHAPAEIIHLTLG
jgi:predicted MPP superfamily phosphohydrolase